MGNRRSPERTEIDAGTQRVLSALGWSHGNPRTALANLMHQRLTACVSVVGAVVYVGAGVRLSCCRCGAYMTR